MIFLSPTENDRYHLARLLQQAYFLYDFINVSYNFVSIRRQNFFSDELLQVCRSFYVHRRMIKLSRPSTGSLKRLVSREESVNFGNELAQLEQ